jgi:hypothetical protein
MWHFPRRAGLDSGFNGNIETGRDSGGIGRLGARGWTGLTRRGVHGKLSEQATRFGHQLPRTADPSMDPRLRLLDLDRVFFAH